MLSRADLCFVLLFVIPSYFSGGEGFLESRWSWGIPTVSPEGGERVLSRKQRGVCWTLQQHYREADPSSPVRTASSQWSLEREEMPSPTPTDYKSVYTTLTKSQVTHRAWIHGGRDSNSEQGPSKGKTKGRPKSLGFRVPTYQTVWSFDLLSIRLLA